ncbi:MAG: glycosyltransferase family 39 protein [Armatimonadetes bacterium]|nr:glycosyltransferase family 39 protein [Armatimonadota bacterium]
MIDTGGASAKRALIALFLLALIIRVGYVLTLGDGVRWPDEAEYHGIAVNLLEGKGYSYFRDYGSSALGPTAYRAPALPGMLAALYFVTGPHLMAARVLQAILGALLIPLGYLIAREMNFSRRAGLLAAFALALYPYYVFCAGAVYPVVISSVLVASATLLLLRGRRSERITPEIFAGLGLGIAVLAFGHVIGALPLVAVWILLNKQRASRAAAVAMLIGCLIAITPWVVRNKIAVGKAGLSTAFEYNLCLGNAPGAKWDSGSAISLLEPAALSKQVAKLREGDAARLYFRTAIDEIRSNPGRIAVLSLGKALNYWRFYPNTVARTVSLREKLIGAMTYGPALLLSLVWLIADRRRFRLNFLLWSYPVAAMLLAAISVSVDRYRIPFDIYLIIFAAGAISSWLGWQAEPQATMKEL